jgi:very-long-chain ceramide synthase
MLKYCGFKTACNIVFGLFTISWTVARHCLHWYIIYSSWFESSQFIEDKWAPEEGHYLSDTVRSFFLTLLIILQILIHYWFYFICRIAYRLIKGDDVQDNKKSDSNDSECSEW